MWNGSSAYSNSNSFGEEKIVRTFPLVFRLGLAVPEMLVTGAS